MTVRHGNMVVGTTATGKTTVSEVLAEALTKLHKDGHGDTDPWYQPINIKTLNPKAVLMGAAVAHTFPTAPPSKAQPPSKVPALA